MAHDPSHDRDGSSSPAGDAGSGGAALPGRLRACRRAAGLSRQELADLAGLSERTIRDIESGRRPRPHDKTVLLLAEALACTPDHLGLPSAYHDRTGSGGEEPAPRSEAGPGKAGGRRRRGVALGALAAVTVAAAFVVVGDGGSAVMVRIERGDLVGRAADGGEVVWRRHEDFAFLRLATPPGDEETVVAGTDEGGGDGGRVLMIDRADGRTIWQDGPDASRIAAAFGPRRGIWPAGFRAYGLAFPDLDGDGVAEIVADFTHGTFFPDCVLFLDRGGERLGSYWNRGHLYDRLVVDLDDDGRDEILLGGTNNAPAFQGATLLLFDHACHAGASVDSLSGGPRAMPDSARVRLVFPSFGEPYMSRLGARRLAATDVLASRDGSGAPTISLIVTANAGPGVVIRLDHELRPLQVTANDVLELAVRRWRRDGLAVGEFGSQAWLDAWLTGHHRFEVGRVASPGEPESAG